eukprot:scaffold100929_cov88-Attheya_sp.AAC.1
MNEHFADEILEELGSEINLLTALIPSLEDLIDDKMPEIDLVGNEGNIEAKNLQLNYVFR